MVVVVVKMVIALTFPIYGDPFKADNVAKELNLVYMKLSLLGLGIKLIVQQV